jgi:hypothetical protein
MLFNTQERADRKIPCRALPPRVIAIEITVEDRVTVWVAQTRAPSSLYRQ